MEIRWMMENPIRGHVHYLTNNYGNIYHFFMRKLTISMAIFNSYVTNYQGV